MFHSCEYLVLFACTRDASLLAIFIRVRAQKTELSFTCADRKVLAHPDGVLGPASQVGEAVALFPRARDGCD
jgi:hypothetical protein